VRRFFEKVSNKFVVIKEKMMEGKSKFQRQEGWKEEFEKYFDCTDFSQLELDDQPTIGYTFKAMGAALLSFRQFALDGPSDPSSFIFILNRITAEAGDADSNACVAGSLMGLHLGFSAFPPSFLLHLPHFPEMSRLALLLLSKQGE